MWLYLTGLVSLGVGLFSLAKHYKDETPEPNEYGADPVEMAEATLPNTQEKIFDKNLQVTRNFNTKEFVPKKWASPNFVIYRSLLVFAQNLRNYLSTLYGRDMPIYVNSGYRSPKQNANTPGAVSNSQHVLGKAMDVHVKGISVDKLAEAGRKVGIGGVGRYYKDGFVHFDVGRKRDWDDTQS
jgi:hypothetical protein